MPKRRHSAAPAVLLLLAAALLAAGSSAARIDKKKPPRNVVAPKVLGTAVVGQSIHLTRGRWSGSPRSYGTDGSAATGTAARA